MSLKRECDRCEHLTPVNSLNGRDFREVKIERGTTPSASMSSTGLMATTTLYDDYDLCQKCVLELKDWLAKAPQRAVASA